MQLTFYAKTLFSTWCTDWLLIWALIINFSGRLPTYNLSHTGSPSTLHTERQENTKKHTNSPESPRLDFSKKSDKTWLVSLTVPIYGWASLRTIYPRHETDSSFHCHSLNHLQWTPPKKNSALFALKCEPPLPCQNSRTAIISVLSNDSYDSTGATNRSMSCLFSSTGGSAFHLFQPFWSIFWHLHFTSESLNQIMGKDEKWPMKRRGNWPRWWGKPCPSWGNTLKPLWMVAWRPLS